MNRYIMSLSAGLLASSAAGALAQDATPIQPSVTISGSIGGTSNGVGPALFMPLYQAPSALLFGQVGTMLGVAGDASQTTYGLIGIRALSDDKDYLTELSAGIAGAAQYRAIILGASITDGEWDLRLDGNRLVSGHSLSTTSGPHLTGTTFANGGAVNGFTQDAGGVIYQTTGGPTTATATGTATQTIAAGYSSFGAEIGHTWSLTDDHRATLRAAAGIALLTSPALPTIAGPKTSVSVSYAIDKSTTASVITGIQPGLSPRKYGAYVGGSLTASLNETLGVPEGVQYAVSPQQTEIDRVRRLSAQLDAGQAAIDRVHRIAAEMEAGLY